MSQVILYKQDSGVVAVVIPSDEALATYGIDAIAKKDVPEGCSYKIVNFSELPQFPQEQWTYADSFFTSGIGEQD